MVLKYLLGVIKSPVGTLCKKVHLSVAEITGNTFCRHLSALPPTKPVVEKKFINRNPRNLEFLGIAWKRLGWKFQYPNKEFYHRIVFERTNRHTAAFVEHSSGVKIILASTKELAIARHLYSTTDVSAAENIGRVLAERCKQSGITEMILHQGENDDRSEKFQSFQKALVDGGIDLSEPEEVVADYEPGIDYSNKEEVDDLHRRQWLVYKLGTKSRTMKILSVKRKLRGRRRPLPTPTALEQPSYTFT